jgi:hypothetical protein
MTSVKFKATPPAFKLTRNTVVSTLVTEEFGYLQISNTDSSHTEVLDCSISSLWSHGSFETTKLDSRQRASWR